MTSPYRRFPAAGLAAVAIDSASILYIQIVVNPKMCSLIDPPAPEWARRRHAADLPRALECFPLILTRYRRHGRARRHPRLGVGRKTWMRGTGADGRLPPDSPAPTLNCVIECGWLRRHPLLRPIPQPLARMLGMVADERVVARRHLSYALGWWGRLAPRRQELDFCILDWMRKELANDADARSSRARGSLCDVA